MKPSRTRRDYAAEDAAAFEEWRQERVQRRLALWKTQVPPVFDREDEPLHPEIRSWCDRFSAGDRGSLVVVGPVGTGKTWAAWHAIKYLIQVHEWMGRYDVCPAHRFARVVAPPLDEEQVDRWARVDLLVLDDLGSQRISDWGLEVLTGLVDDRWAHARPTVITSNDGNLAALLGERAASRIRDEATIVQITGADRRRPR